MPLAERIEKIKDSIRQSMDSGYLRETPGEITNEIEKKTSRVIHRISKTKAKPKARRWGLVEIFAASVAEDQLKKEVDEGQ